MDRKTLTAALAATLSTLAEVGTGPKSAFYLALGCDMEVWHAVERIMVQSGWATPGSDHTISITEAGRAIAARVDATIEAKS